MGIDLVEQPRLGDPLMSIDYQRIESGMDPKVSTAISDRDRMDWLERSIIAIRAAMDEHDLRITEAESGYGRVSEQINSLSVAVENYRTELGAPVARATTDSAWLSKQLAGIIAAIKALGRKISATCWWRFWK